MLSFQLIKDVPLVNPTTHVTLPIESELADAKSQIDTFHAFDPKKLEYYRRITSYLDPFKHVMRHKRDCISHPKAMTNAWLKCWEMIHVYDLIRPKKELTVFCNAELPGAFLFAIHHYITAKLKQPYQWYANSLYPSKDDILGDEFGLYRHHKERWMMDETNGGSVTNLEMIRHIATRMPHTVDLYTSDIGIGLTFDTFNKQEELEAPLHLGQVICGLHTLAEGGNMVCKMFMFFKPFSVSLLYGLTRMFDAFYISKPETSRPGNSEVYIIGKGYRHNSDYVAMLENVLSHWSEEQVYAYIEPVPDVFYDQLVSISESIYRRQIAYITEQVSVVRKLYDQEYLPEFHSIKHVLKQELKKGYDITENWLEQYNIPNDRSVSLV